jgi:DNA invertase Pin-like site-specific DNA recombinase
MQSKKKAAPETVGAYIRVSTRAQDYEAQRDAIERAASARGHDVAHWYAEKANASTAKRIELERMRLAVRAGVVRTLYVFRVDRLSRRGIRDTLAIVEELRSCGCELVTIADGFDVHGPAGEVVLAVMAWAAKMETLALRERITAARTRIEEQGGAWGRPRRMDPKTVEQARARSARGETLRQIAMALKVPRATVGRALAQKPMQKSWRPGPLKTGGKRI